MMHAGNPQSSASINVGQQKGLTELLSTMRLPSGFIVLMGSFRGCSPAVDLILACLLAFQTAASSVLRMTKDKCITYQERIAAGQGLQAEDMQAELQHLRTEVLLLRAEKQQALAAVKVSIGSAALLQCSCRSSEPTALPAGPQALPSKQHAAAPLADACQHEAQRHCATAQQPP